MQKQVEEVREIQEYFRTNSSEESSGEYKRKEERLKHLLLLETCNAMWDITPLSAAINHLYENPPPTSLQRLLGRANPEPADFDAFDNAIPFESGSDEWGFVILLAYKQFLSVYDEECPETALLRADQSSVDACIDNSLVCASCLKPGTEDHSQKLKRCSHCQVIRYCSATCQKEDWPKHKKRCRKERIKPDPEAASSGRYTRRRYHYETNLCWTFVKHHPFPNHESMLAMNNGFLGRGVDYTPEMYELFKNVYEHIAKNPYKVYGRELGEYLYRMGGKDYMYLGEQVFTQVINTLPRDGLGSPETTEVMARNLLCSSWGGIGGWQG